MTAYKPILISNYEVGLERDLKPWLLPNDGFPDLEDCFVYRGRVIRKQSSRKIGRLQQYNPIGNTTLGTHTTKPQTFSPAPLPLLPVAPNSLFITDSVVTYQDDGQGNIVSTNNVSITGISQASAAVISFATAPPFSVGDLVWITGTVGMPTIDKISLTVLAVGATSIMVNFNSSTAEPWIMNGVVNWYGGNLNYATGVYTVTFYNAANTDAVIASAGYYPALPAMGLTQEQTPAINQKLLIAFDTTKAYRFNNSTGQFNDISFNTNIGTQSGSFSWTGANFNFFWSLNYANALFTTNNVDPIRYLAYANTTGNPEVWRNFTPIVNNSNSTLLNTALMIFGYRGRLVFINTTESGQNFPQRARWSQLGTPYYNTSGGVDTPPAPFSAEIDAWYDDAEGKGGFTDAPTREKALSGAFIDDNLVVFFENSTWILRFLGDQNNSFVWERVNSDYGSQCTFSAVPFDKGVFAVGNIGIISSDSNDVIRIDQKIPDVVFSFQNKNQGPQRVQGIRNFRKQLVYWTYPNDAGGIYPNKILVLNFIEASYAIFNDSFTCFGTYEPAEDITWANLRSTWQGWDYTWANPTGQQFDPQVAGGNQQGYILQLDAQDYPDPSLFLAAITTTSVTTITSPNHNLEPGDFIALTGLQGTGNLSQFTSQILRVDTVIDANNFSIQSQSGNQFDSGYSYVANGEIVVIPNFTVYTKRFNLGLASGLQTSLGFTDFYVDRDNTGQFQVDLYVDDDNSQPVYSLAVSTAPEPNTSFTPEKIWKRVYTRLIGQFYQYKLYLSDAQMYNQQFKITDFELHGMIMHVSKAGRITY